VTGALLLFSASSFGAERIKIEKVDRHDIGVIYTGERIENGRVFAVDLSAPGTITTVEYSCDGEVCATVHKCPDGGKCVNFMMDGHKVNGYPETFHLRGSHAIFNAWTTSSRAALPDSKKDQGVFTFKIHYVVP
jgi:hypothetical protein